jgi:uncharacterized membrane protein YGL010W
MRRVDVLLTDYGSFHRTRGNFLCHCLGIPLIVFGILAVLRLIPVVSGIGVTAAEIAIAGACLYYAFLDPLLAAAMLVALGLLDLAARAVGDWRVGAAAFVAGWVFQAIGHARYEKKAPAFLRNLVHLLIGPLFLVNEVLRVRPLSPPLGARE